MNTPVYFVAPNFSERSDNHELENVLVVSDEQGLTPDVAVTIANGIHAHILSALKIKHLDTSVDPYDVFTEYRLRDDLDDLDSYSLEELAAELAVSEIPGSRGTRLVLIVPSENLILVGTAVVYNPRRATIGVVDASVPTTILDF